MERIHVKKKYEYQIITDIGETVGLPFDNMEAAENTLKEILKNEQWLQELCPDTDITTIKYLTVDIIDTGKLDKEASVINGKGKNR